MITADEATVGRFLSYVDELPCGCWFWTGARSRGRGNKKWYGSFNAGPPWGVVRAHRFSVEVFNRVECPPGHHRDHRCRFSLCVNPDCIEVVTATVNQERKTDRAPGDAALMDRLLAHVEGINDERDSVPILLAVRDLWSKMRGGA